MTPDEILLEVDGGSLAITGPDAVVDEVVAAVATDKNALLAVIDVFGPVAVVSAGTPAVWPPKGGVVPAWRRVSSRRPLVVLPTEQRPAIDPFAAAAPTVPCPTCTAPRLARVPPETVFETGPWQRCVRCGGHRWRSTVTGDVCAACGPVIPEPAPATWVRAGDGWVCSKCHPPVSPDDRPVCAICGSKGACRSGHADRLRQLGTALLRRTRSVKKQVAIRAALEELG